MQNALYIDDPEIFKVKLINGLIDLSPIAIGTIDAPILQSDCAIAIGIRAGYFEQGECAIAIGERAGETSQANDAIAIGSGAGQEEQSTNSIAIGTEAGNQYQFYESIAIGSGAGFYNQQTQAIAIGSESGQYNQSYRGIALGFDSAKTNQNVYAIAIGSESGMYQQGSYSIAIGRQAGQTSQPQNSIVLNATGSALGSVTKASALYVAPVQQATSSNMLYYNTSTREVTYDSAPNSVPNGNIYSDYLFWNSNSSAWNVGSGELHLGANAGKTSQQSYAIALGFNAGSFSQGTNAIAIGKFAGQTSQPQNSIVLNATGSALSSTTKASGFYVAPINSGTSSSVLYYDASSREVTYGSASGGGGFSGQTYYNDFLNTIMYSTSTVNTGQVTNTLSPSSNIPSFPVMPSVVVPGSFNYTIGSGGDFADLQTALASPLVTNGMNLRIFAGTYAIPDTTGIVISKQVGIYGVGASSVILQTTATASAPVNAISVRAPNVTLYGITFQHRKTTNTSIESCISIADTSVSPQTGLNNVVVDSCRIEFMEFGIVVYGDNFRITNCTKLAYVGPTNSTRRTIGVYRSTGNSFIVNNILEDNGASGALRFIQLTTTTGLVTEIFSGNLVVQNNVQTMNNPLSQFYNQDWFGSSGNSTFSLFLDNNDTNETSAFVVLFLGAANSGNMFDKIVLTNNSCWNSHGKGIVTVDASSALAFRSIGNLPLYVSKNVVGYTGWRTGFLPVPGSFGNIFGYNSLFVSSVATTVTTGNALAVVSIANDLGYISSGSCSLVVYASAPSTAPVTYSFGYTNINGYGSAFQSLASGTFNVTSTLPTAYTLSFSIPYTLLPYLFNRLRLELSTSGSTVITIYSRSSTSGTVQTTICTSNIIPTYAGVQTFGSVAASASSTVSVIFPRVFNNVPSIVSNVNSITGSTNADYILCSVENTFVSGCTIRFRNLHTSAAANGIGINWIATDSIGTYTP